MQPSEELRFKALIVSVSEDTHTGSRLSRGTCWRTICQLLNKESGRNGGFFDRLLTMLIMVIKRVFNTNVETNQITLYISLCLAGTV